MESSATPKYFQTMSPAATSPTTTTTTTTPAAPQQSAPPPPSTNNPSNNNPTPPTHTTPKHPTVSPPRKPLLRLELRDLSTDGSRAFLRLLHASTALEDAVHTVLHHLYLALPAHHIPATRSITLVLEAMDGVAYTTGSDLDADHKSIHLSTRYIAAVGEARQKEEMLGVLVHEMVHCWQHDARGTAPGGLIEGIADWVRLKAGYAPPHWKRSADAAAKWDAGYERTGFFLEWLEEAHGEDVVRRINDALRGCEYEEGSFWRGCCGKGVEALWKEYQASLGGGDETPGKGSEESGRDGRSEATNATELDVPDNKVIPVRPRFT